MRDHALMIAPCGHLIERDPPECAMSRRIPEDCHRACAYYDAGVTDQERVRATLWAEIRRRARTHYTLAEGAGHD